MLSSQENYVEKFIQENIYYLEDQIELKEYENMEEKRYLEGQISAYIHSLIIFKYFQNGSI